MHPSLHLIYVEAALLCAGVAAVTDLRSRRIPNWLTGPSFVLGLLLHLAFSGPSQAGWALLAGVIAGSLFLLLFVAGGMGAGDVKLMAAVGCLVGIGSVRDVLLATVLLGALLAIVLAASRGKLRETLGNAFTLLGHHQAHGLAVHPELNVLNRSLLRLPYAVPIAGGCLVTLLLRVHEGLTL